MEDKIDAQQGLTGEKAAADKLNDTEARNRDWPPEAFEDPALFLKSAPEEPTKRTDRNRQMPEGTVK
jgi:hypothetical protein